MQRQLAWGILAATALGVVAGVTLAPAPARRELRRRAARNFGRLENLAVRESRAVLKVAGAAATAVGQTLDAAFEVVLRPLSSMRPSLVTRLKDALGSDPILKQRDIWVDAHGSTILLHGVVEDDEEWRSADCLARLASPDGSVRNLLQVRRRDDVSG